MLNVHLSPNYYVSTMDEREFCLYSLTSSIIVVYKMQHNTQQTRHRRIECGVFKSSWPKDDWETYYEDSKMAALE